MRALALTLAMCGTATFAQETSPMTTATHHATGPFEAKLAPEPLSGAGERAGLSRMSLDKRFHGDLEAESFGEMLAFGNPKQGNAGYVAIEKVSGRLQGRRGSFALQHSSTLTQGVPHQSVSVVPGSGTGELQGLSGTMVIDIAPDGSHSYRFDYTLP
jgi:hypothetical protein